MLRGCLRHDNLCTDITSRLCRHRPHAAHDRYDEARTVFNGAIDRRPALIAECGDARDVAAALRLAREDGLEVAVRAGGHSGAGYGVNDGGLVSTCGP